MVEARTALYRLDFCADLTAARSPVFNLGYMLEAAVEGGARFLGLASRVSLTRVEMDHVNFATWPELEKLDGFMADMFQHAWSFVEAATVDDLRLGSEELARRFGAMSAFHVGKLDLDSEITSLVHNPSEQVWQQEWYGKLLGFGKLLKPTLTGEVLQFAPAVQAPLAEPRPKYRSEAA